MGVVRCRVSDVLFPPAAHTLLPCAIALSLGKVSAEGNLKRFDHVMRAEARVQRVLIDMPMQEVSRYTIPYT